MWRGRFDSVRTRRGERPFARGFGRHPRDCSRTPSRSATWRTSSQTRRREPAVRPRPLLGMSPQDGFRVGVAGATGAVGSTILEVLAQRKFPAAEVVPFTSARSAGKKVAFAGTDLECRELSPESIQGLDL